MADIRLLTDLDETLLERLISGYTTTEVYQVVREESPGIIRFDLRLTSLAQPFVKRYPPSVDDIAFYRFLVKPGHAFGAFEDDACVGIALCEPQSWNRSLIVHEFHVAPDHQHKGIGRDLMSVVEVHARDLAMRCVVCETQNTNVPAIRFYRALGFTLDGLDTSLYSNNDLERGEIAVFMKLLVQPR